MIAAATQSRTAPIRVRRVTWKNLPAAIRAAIEHQADESGFSDEWYRNNNRLRFRIETFRTVDIINMFTDWGWHRYDEMESSDRFRVEKVLGLLLAGDAPWPYYSYWCESFAALSSSNGDDHGAGWHRMTAQHLFGCATVGLVFDDRPSRA